MTQFYSRVDTELNGDVYSIPFSYIKQDEINVYLNDELFINWEFLNDSQIKFLEIPADLPNDTIVSIRRITDISKKVVDYTNQSMLNETSLNLSQDQLLNAIQEVYDNNEQFKIDTTIIVNDNKEELEGTIEANRQEILDIQSSFEEETNTNIQEFEDGIDAKIATVAEAADKINTLDESIQLCENSAEIATEQAEIAASKADEIINVKDELEAEIDTKANVDLSNLSTAGQAKFDAKANLNLSNLSETGEKHFLNKTQIANCLLEIPQNIKLELSDGVLTLKAGSKVIVPNGFEADGTTPKFDEVVVKNDIIARDVNNNRTSMVFYRGDGVCYGNINTSVCSSGDTFPSTLSMFYNTSTNKVYYIDSAGVVHDYTWSFPLAIITTSSETGVTSIDQIFNGFGYIGSTLWLDKGVKGLIPNGRNEDGSLKNIEVTSTKLTTITNPFGANPNPNSIMTLNINGNVSVQHRFIESITEPTTNFTTWFNPITNNQLYRGAQGSEWTKLTVVPVASLNWTYIANPKTNTFTSLVPKLPFRAVDYNDFNKVSSRYVVEKSPASLLPSWYTVYSDGWIEQGGLCTLPATWVTNTFLKSFKDTNYSLFITPINSANSNYFTHPADVARIDKNSFQSGMYEGNSSWYACWRACGY